MLHKIKKYRRLSRQQRRCLRRAALPLLIIKIGLRYLPYATFRRWYNRSLQVDESLSVSENELMDTALAVSRLSGHWPWRAVCLPQALTYRYLLRHDPDLTLKIGVNHGLNGEFQAHAWVEKAGRLLIGETGEQYVPLWDWKK